jgi:hypothetical protein
MDCKNVQLNIAVLFKYKILPLLVLSRALAIQDGCCAPVTPPPSCLEALLQVWANLVADWNAWEEEEDESVFDSIEEAVALQVRSNLFSFSSWHDSKASVTSGIKLMHMIQPVPGTNILACITVSL